MANPLLRNKRLDPIPSGGGATTSDIEARLRGAMHPGEAILARGMKSDYKFQISSNSNMYKTSAPVHLNVAPEDNLDTKEIQKIIHQNLFVKKMNYKFMKRTI